MRRELVIGAGWLVGVATAALVGVTTISALGAGGADTGSAPLTAQQVRDRLAGDGASPEPGASPSAGPSGTSSVSPVWQSTPGGNVQAWCAGGLVTLGPVIPAQGFEIDGIDRGPGPAAFVNLKSRSPKAEYRVTITCGADGTPVAESRPDD